MCGYIYRSIGIHFFNRNSCICEFHTGAKYFAIQTSHLNGLKLVAWICCVDQQKAAWSESGFEAVIQHGFNGYLKKIKIHASFSPRKVFCHKMHLM